MPYNAYFGQAYFGYTYFGHGYKAHADTSIIRTVPTPSIQAAHPVADAASVALGTTWWLLGKHTAADTDSIVSVEAAQQGPYVYGLDTGLLVHTPALRRIEFGTTVSLRIQGTEVGNVPLVPKVGADTGTLAHAHAAALHAKWLANDYTLLGSGGTFTLLVPGRLAVDSSGLASLEVAQQYTLYVRADTGLLVAVEAGSLATTPGQGYPSHSGGATRAQWRGWTTTNGWGGRPTRTRAGTGPTTAPRG